MSLADTLDKTELENDYGWPHSLCLIEVSPNKYAANVADTKGLEPDPQHGIHGLAVFATPVSAKVYMQALNGLSGTIVPKTFNECKEIALARPPITALFLMHGAKIKDVINLK